MTAAAMNESPTQRDYQHDTQSSPHLGTTGAKHGERNSTTNSDSSSGNNRHARATNTWHHGDRTISINNKDDENDDESVPRDEGLFVESQVDMHRDKLRSHVQDTPPSRLTKSDGDVQRHSEDERPVIYNSSEPDGFQDQDGDDTVEMEAPEHSNQQSQETQPVNVIESSGEDATQQVFVKEPVYPPKGVKRGFDDDNAGAQDMPGTDEPTQMVNHINNTQAEEDATQVVGKRARVDPPSSPDRFVGGPVEETQESQPTQQVNNNSDEDATQQVVPPSTTQRVKANIQVASTPLSQAMAKRLGNHLQQHQLQHQQQQQQKQEDQPPSSAEAIVSSDDEANPTQVIGDPVKPKQPPQEADAKTKRALITPARPSNVEVGNSSPGNVLYEATARRNNNVNKKSGLAEETPITRQPSKLDKTPPSNRKIQHVSKDGVSGQCAWVRWTDEKYYPVKCLDKNRVSKRLQFSETPLCNNNTERVDVLFGDGREGEATLSRCYPLDLKPGDVVKFDGEKKTNFKVVRLESRDDCGTFVTVDGDNCCVLEAKNGRQLEVAIWRLYIVRKLWADYLAKREKLVNAFEAESVLVVSPRRANKIVKYEEYEDANSSLPANSNGNIATEGIFQQCVFAITIETSPSPKFDEDLVSVIERNGGVVLREGFGEMFEDSGEQYQANDAGVGYLELKPRFQALRLAAVVGNTHRRTHKYIEALALGLPCLSYQYVQDCAAHGELLPLSSYLLAAGHSSVLNTVISHDIGQFKQCVMDNGRPFSEFWQTRDPILKTVAAQPVFLIEPGAPGGQAKQRGDESRDTFRFLVRACGCYDLRIVDGVAKLPQDADAIAVCNTKTLKTKHAVHDHTPASANTRPIIYSRQWLIECIINRRPV